MRNKIRLIACAMLALVGITPAFALDKVTVSVNPVSSALPYFIAVDRGYFKDAGIETDMKRIAVPTLAISGASDVNEGSSYTLGLSSFDLAAYPRYTRRASDARMTDAARARLTAHFRPHNEQLAALLGEDVWWAGP